MAAASAARGGLTGRAGGGRQPGREHGRQGMLSRHLLLELGHQHGGVGLGTRALLLAPLQARHLELGRLLPSLVGPLFGLLLLLGEQSW